MLMLKLIEIFNEKKKYELKTNNLMFSKCIMIMII